MSGLRLMNKTLAGPSGFDFGHLRSCTRNLFQSNFGSSLSHLIFYGSGATSTEWNKSLICTMKNRAQEEQISRLRFVVLTKADFNSNK